jgi:hypothetical protein
VQSYGEKRPFRVRDIVRVKATGQVGVIFNKGDENGEWWVGFDKENENGGYVGEYKETKIELI